MSLPTRSRPRHAAPAALLRCESLEDRLAPAAAVTDIGVTKSPISVTLGQMAAAYATGAADWAAPFASMFVSTTNQVGVRLQVADVAAARVSLAGLGFTEAAADPAAGVLDGYLHASQLTALGGVAGLTAARELYRPRTATGSVTTQADASLFADRVRGALPTSYNGSGIRIGVISDSYNNRGGAPADVASGDLPSSLTVVRDLPAGNGGTDEGRAMLQIINDIAPGAQLFFATCGTSDMQFANSIRALAAVGCDIIVDDIVFFNEPFFQDGRVAQAITQVTGQGVAYFSAAGNQANQAYETTAATFVNDATLLGGGRYLDFDPGAGTDIRQSIILDPNETIQLVLQWDSPFFNRSASNNDLDIYLIQGNTIVASSSFDDIGQLEHFEVLTFTNNGAMAQTYDIVIQNFAGPDPGRVKYIDFGDGGPRQFFPGAPTLVAHATAPGGAGVGAVPFFDQDTPEDFTSQGPYTVLFSPTGQRLTTPQVRQGPLFAAVDGGDTTFFGQSNIPDLTAGFPNFFGTSAAAPAAAAIAALVLQANPSFTPAQIYTRLQSTAEDLGPVNFDTLTGAGLINAYRAVFGPPVPATGPFTDGFETGGIGAPYDVDVSGAGRVQVTSQFGPNSGTSHVVMGTNLNALQNGLSTLTLSVNTTGATRLMLSFAEKEFNDSDNPMSLMFMGSEDTDGVAVSFDDGTTWYRVVSLTDTASTNTYQTFSNLDLFAIAQANGIMTLPARTLVRFQNFASGPAELTRGGMAFDDIVIDTGGVITGLVFNDANGNGTQDSGEAGVAGVTIYLDTMPNGMFDSGEQSAVTDATGRFRLINVAAGTYTVREVVPPGSVPTTPMGGVATVTVTNGATTGPILFGNFPLATVSGVVFSDANANGVRDGGETGVPNVVVYNDTNGNGVRDGGETSVTTDGSGTYAFSGQGPGALVRARIVTPANTTRTTGDPAPVTVPGPTSAGDFGLFLPASIGGVVFNDTNGNGVRDAGEAGVPNVVVFNDTNGNGVRDAGEATSVTTGTGAYAFTGLGPGALVRARIEVPAGLFRTSADPAALFVPGAASAGNFGLFSAGGLGGTVYRDSNENGVRDAGEAGIAGVTVTLDIGNDGTIDRTTTTGSDGSYQFTNLGPGVYAVRRGRLENFRVAAPSAGVYVTGPLSGAVRGGLDFGSAPAGVLVAGSDFGAAGTVSVYDADTRRLLTMFNPYGPGFLGGVRVASGDVTGDGVPDIITGTAAGIAPHVKVFDGVTFAEVMSFFAYAPAFLGGVFVAAGDLNGDGFAEVITGAGPGAGPHVKAFDGRTGLEMLSYLAFDPGVTGGVSVAAGDLNGDGRNDIVVGVVSGGSPLMRAFDIARGGILFTAFAYAPGVASGVFVATGDLNGDGIDDLIAGAASGRPRVTVFDTTTGRVRYQFVAGDAPVVTEPVTQIPTAVDLGVRVATGDADGDGIDDLFTARSGQLGRVGVVRGLDLTPLDLISPFGSTYGGGVFVGG
jgi:hypothetical protein